MEVIVGTYEHYILGYKLIEIADGFELQSSFSTNAHMGSIRCLASSSKYLVSGSTDETVHVFNMKTRKEVGSLTQHDGTISCLEFYKDNYLITGSEDKTICIWTTTNWQCQKTLRGHKNDVTDLSVHPSGKLLLSVAKDKTLKTWNLVKGRSTYVTNIRSVAQFVSWSPDGVNFVVVFDFKFDVYNTQTAGVIYTVDSKKKFSCLVFMTESIMAIAEAENIALYDIRSKSLINTFTAHENRIKTIACVPPPSGEPCIRWLISVSSDGFVKIWEFSLESITDKPKLVTSLDTTCRPTCLSVWGVDLSINVETQTDNLMMKEDSKTKTLDESQIDLAVKRKRKKLRTNKRD